MTAASSNAIRKQYVDFFVERDHRFVPGWPLAPPDDPTLLFTNAGMNQFKDIFLGRGARDYSRAVNYQKCLRVSGKHNDLEEVGRDTYHHTFFEMLGNWSFGDYFKKEAIAWAWELLTQVWGLDPKRLYATVYRDDDEAEALWKQISGMPDDRILRFDDKDNFWEMGETGPCGPCSEIHYDCGEQACSTSTDPRHRCGVNSGCSRYIELWNLVFIQYERMADRSLRRLPARHVDTGAGFERIVAVLQGVPSNFQTDLFAPIIDKIASLSGVPFDNMAQGTPHRVIADHLRALAFAIADGILPSNEGRGYVLRRILRRAARFSRKLDLHEPVIHLLVDSLVGIMGEAFPELVRQKEGITQVVRAEERSFGRTLDRGIEIFEETARRLITKGDRVIPARSAFVLYDRFGFPIDLTVLMAEEKNLAVDLDGFNAMMAQKRVDTRLASGRPAAMPADAGDQGAPTVFVGYEKVEEQARVVFVRALNDSIAIRLDRTPFYAEAGGQIGDQGTLSAPGLLFEVHDTQRAGDGVLHEGCLVRGEAAQLREDLVVSARIDVERRLDIARNHTATHLLQGALRRVIGEHVQQQSSLVAPEHLRFDFNHFSRVTQEELEQVEQLVNEKIRENLPVKTHLMELQEARDSGALAFFGEKYKEQVRVVEIEGFSRELCGGTHLQATGQIGMFKIMQEGASAAGIRRIVAVSGRCAEQQSRSESRTLAALRELLQAGTGEELSKVERLLDDRKALKKELSELSHDRTGVDVREILNRSVTVHQVRIATGSVEASDLESLKTAGDLLRDGLRSGIGVLGAVADGKVLLVCVVTSDLIKQKGLKAGEIVSRVARIVGGGGGGKPHMATAGGRDASRLQEALQAVPGVVGALLE